MVFEEEEERETNSEKEESGIDVSPLSVDTSEVLLNSLVGWTGLQTMHAKVKIQQQEVVILVDYGATYNFIVESAVEKFGLQVTNTVCIQAFLFPSTSLERTYVEKQICHVLIEQFPCQENI